MALTAPPPAVTANDEAPVFDAKAYARLAWEAQNVAEMNALQADVDAKRNYVASAWDAAGGISTGLGQAVSAAAQAAAARDVALGAVATAVSGGERLAAISQSLHFGSVVEMVRYDTSRDSDGGAWRQKCQQMSWYQEAIQAGKWLGRVYGGEVDARAVGRTLGANIGPVTTSTTGWVNPFNVNPVSDGTSIQLVTSTAGQSARSISKDLTGLTIGTRYRVSCDWVSVASTASARPVVRVRNAADTADIATGATDYLQGTAFTTFVATAATHRLTFRWDSGATSQIGEFASFNNVLVQPVLDYNTGGGDYYQNTTDGKFYALSAGSGQTEVFRGNVRDFPAVAGIVAESSRVVIYDLTAPGCPMWRVFAATANAAANDWWRVNRAATSLAARDGTVYIGLNTSADGYSALLMAKFLHDYLDRVGNSFATSCRSTFGNPSVGVSLQIPGYLVSQGVNDVAVTVLDNAPTDLGTGLPVPTIAVATSGGVSVIKHDGTVGHITGQSNQIRTMGFIGNLIYSSASFYDSLAVYNIPTGTVSWSAYLERYGANGLNSSVGGSVLTMTPTAWSSSSGVTLLKRNPSASALGVIAAITNTSNSGWQVGDSRLAALADTVAETITGAELAPVASGFSNASGWAGIGTSIPTLSAVGGNLRVIAGASEAGWFAGAELVTGLVVGKTYKATVNLAAQSGWTSFDTWQARVMLGSSIGVAIANNAAAAPLNVPSSVTFVATETSHYVGVRAQGTFVGGTSTMDISLVSVKLVDADRSVKGNPLNIVGSITKTPVAAGAQLVAYSGFGASNYLEQPYSANLDFGTGDFRVAVGGNFAVSGSQYFFDRGTPGGGAGGGPRLGIGTSAGRWYLICSAGGTSSIDTGVAATAGVHKLEMYRVSGVLKLAVDGVEVFSAANTVNLTNTSAVLRIGLALEGSAIYAGSLALLHVGATAPSADQIAKAYRDELQLFQPGAQCTIAGTSSAVTALSYDDSTDLLHVATSWGRTSFSNLLRVDSEATTVGALTTISAQDGVILQGGTSGRVYQPALTLRDELKRKREARLALGKEPVFFDFDPCTFTASPASGTNTLTASSVVGTPYVGMGITGSGIPAGTVLTAINGSTYTMSNNASSSPGAVTLAQNTLTLQQGYSPKAVYVAGALKRLGATKDYVLSDDGFRKTLAFGVGSGSWVSVMAVRA